jgi:hypothetical protein
MRSFISNSRAPSWHEERGQIAAEQAILELRKNLEPIRASDDERLETLRRLTAEYDDSCSRIAEAISFALDTAHHYQDPVSILRYWLMFYCQDHGHFA